MESFFRHNLVKPFSLAKSKHNSPEPKKDKPLEASAKKTIVNNFKSPLFRKYTKLLSLDEDQDSDEKE